MRVKKLFLILLLIFSLPVFSAEQSKVVFTSPKNPITITQKHPTFTITLQSNPTTGFSWQLISYDKNLIEFVGHQFVAPRNKKLIGAPGYETWTFKAKKNVVTDQTTQIILQYARPWTKDNATKTRFTIKINPTSSDTASPQSTTSKT